MSLGDGATTSVKIVAALEANPVAALSLDGRCCLGISKENNREFFVDTHLKPLLRASRTQLANDLSGCLDPDTAARIGKSGLQGVI